MKITEKHKRAARKVANEGVMAAKEIANKHLTEHEDEFTKFVDDVLATVRRGLLEFYAEVRKYMGKQEPVLKEPEKPVQPGHHVNGQHQKAQVSHHR